MKKSVFLLFINLVYNSQVFAIFVGEVVKIRGNVSILEPGFHKAKSIILGTKLKVESSILTGKHSFCRIQFKDGSIINLGSQSKIVISEFSQKNPGVLSLLKGKIRTIVKKENGSNNKNKILIRTQTAALGVRGTDFQTIYNSDNKVTNLLTYTGEVAMVKLDDISKANKTYETDYNRDDNTGKIDYHRREVFTPESSADLTKALSEKSVETVKSGQFSATLNNIDILSKPVNINPIQLNILYKNNELNEVSGNNFKASSLDLNKENLSLRTTPQDYPKEGVFNLEDKVYAPKSGGFIDLNTGLYIPPDQNSLYDQKNKIYKAEGIGNIDNITGQYKAPLGLDLDARKGFVTLKLKSNAPIELKNKIVSNQKALNNNLSKDLFISKESDKNQLLLKRKILSARELLSKEVVSITSSFHSYDLEVSEDSLIGSGQNENVYKGENVKELSFVWSHSSGNKWQPITMLGWEEVNFSKGQLNSDSIAQRGSSLLKLGVGLRYSMSPRWSLVSTLSLDQEIFLNHAPNTTGTSFANELIRVTLPKLNIGFEWDIFRNKTGRFRWESELFLLANGSKSSGTFEVDSGVGFSLYTGPRFWWNSKYYSRIGYRYLQESHSSTNTNFNNNVMRKKSGLLLELGAAL